MENYSIYIILTRTDTMISKLIHLLKEDEFTHAAISLDENFNNMYSFSRKNTNNPFIGIFKKEDLNKGVYKRCKTLPGVIVRLNVSEEQYNKAKTILHQFIYNSDYYKYNYKGLFYSLFNKEYCCDNRFLCSEFVYYILSESGIIDFKIPRSLVRPQDLLNVKGDIIYRGDLKELRAPDTFLNTFENVLA